MRSPSARLAQICFLALRFPARWPMPLALLALLGASCGGTKGPAIAMRIAGVSSGGTERCGSASARDGAALSTVPVSKVRITLRSRSADGTTLEFCDRIVDFPNSPPFLRVGSREAASVDIFAEAYGATAADDPTLRRIATGALLGVPPTATMLGPLRLYPAESFRCAPVRTAIARAFHTATLLPDGRVLFVGGLVSSTTNPGATAVPDAGSTATGTAELFDPRDQSITAVDEPTPQGRAFHAAQLLSGSGPCAAGQLAVLLVGGLGPITPGQPILTRSRGMQGTRLAPYNNDALPKPLGIRAVGNEVLCLDATTHTASRLPVAGTAGAFRAVDRGPMGLVAVGGIDYDATMLNAELAKNDLSLFPLSSGDPVSFPVGGARPGASLTVLDDGSALVWGGGPATESAGELITGLAGTPTSMPVVSAATAMTQFHTATRIRGASAPAILMTGGFEVTGGGTNTQALSASRALRRVTVVNGSATVLPVNIGVGYVVDSTCTEDAMRYRPAGWESAVALSRGRVLITGGAPSTLRDMNVTTGPKCVDCMDGSSSALCALPQASIYDDSGLNLRRAAEPLAIARFGHASTTLTDGTVLISGGIGGEPGGGGVNPIFISDLEIYNPRTVVPSYNAAVSSVDPDDPIADDLAAASLGRAPGAAAATAADPTRPARECSTL